MTYDMNERPDIVCENDWHDYTGGADHNSVEEAHACEDETGKSRIVLVPLADYILRFGAG